MSKTTWEAQFDLLALGARFSYIDQPERLYVKLGPNRVAKWDASQVDTGWVAQPICCFDDQEPPRLETHVIVKEGGE
ncbi:MAG: hypothetical protein GY861_01230 [bacterium]|nr:hypothetical protein [bacterium]